MPHTLEIILRTFTSFLLLWIFVQVLGKQIIAQKTYHLYIASITIGAIAGNLAFNIKVKFLYFIISLTIMGFLVFTLNVIAVKNRRFRKWIAGKPVTIIENGQMLEKSMEHLSYSIESLKQALRGKGIFNIEEVEYAILEIDGSLSVLKKPPYQNITKQDVTILPKAETMPVELIYNGKILFENLSKHNYEEIWLMTELKKRNLVLADISYAVVGSKGNLYIDLFQDQLH